MNINKITMLSLIILSLSISKNLIAQKETSDECICYCAFKPGPRKATTKDRPRRIEIFEDEIENDANTTVNQKSQMVCFCKERDIIKFCKKRFKIKPSHINELTCCQ